jgi:hypothetical protein
MARDTHAPHPGNAGARVLAEGAFARPNSSRVWNFVAGGKNNFRADRELYDLLAEVVIAPSVLADIVRDNQAFLERAIRHLHEVLEIIQFIDLGSGIPVGFTNVYNSIIASTPEAKVVYVDNDPVVLATTWRLIVDDRRERIVGGNILDPEQLLKNEILDFLDWSKPIALICTAVLHEHPDLAELTAIMQTYVDHLPPKSCTVISHFLDPENQHTETVRTLEAVMIAQGADCWFRTRAEIEALFPGQELLAHVQPCRRWGQTAIGDEGGGPTLIAGGVGRVQHNGKPT